MGIYDESHGLSLASGKNSKKGSFCQTWGPNTSQKFPFLEWEFQLEGLKCPSEESFKHGDLVQTAHFRDDTVAQRS